MVVPAESAKPFALFSKLTKEAGMLLQGIDYNLCTRPDYHIEVQHRLPHHGRGS